MRKRTSIQVTADFEDINKLDVWFDHLVSVGRPCAIIHREVLFERGSYKASKGMLYSVWRNISEDEREHYNIVRAEQLTGDYEIIKTSGEFYV